MWVSETAPIVIGHSSAFVSFNICRKPYPTAPEPVF